MVALPEPRPETPRQRERREAIENVQRDLLGRQLMFDELSPAGQAARRAEILPTLKGIAVGIPSTIVGLPADIIGLPAAIGELLANLTGQDPNAVYKELAEMSPEERDANLLSLAQSPQEYAALSEFFNSLGRPVPAPKPRPTGEEEEEEDDDDLIPPMLKISRDIQKAAGAEGIARLAGFGDDFEDPNFRQGFTASEVLTPIPLLDFGIPALMRRGSRSTDLVPSEEPPVIPEEVAQQPTRLQSTGDITDTPTTTVPGIEGGIVDFTPPDADPSRDMDIFSFGVEMVHTPTGARIPPETVIRGRFSEFETVERRDARLVNRTEVTQRMATPEETAAFQRGEDPAAVAPGAQAPTTLDDIPVVTLPRTRPDANDEIEVRDFLSNEEFDIQQVDYVEEDSVHVPTGIFIPRDTVVRSNSNDLRVATPEETAAQLQEGVATLPAAEDVIDVEPVAQAALTPVRTEGQEQLRRQAFPVTEDMNVFEPSGITELGPNYLAGDPTSVVPGSGQRGIATTFDYASTSETQARRQGNIADYSPTFQTIDRLPEKPLGTNEPYTPEEVINILEAQPQAGMRDLKGSGFLEYLESPYAPDTYDSVEDIRKDYRNYTAQLKVNTVTNTDIAEQYARAAVDPSTVDPSVPFVYPNVRSGGSIPESGTQSFFEEGTDQAPFDRGVIIINNPNTTKTPDGDTLRAPTVGGIDHDYFGGSSGVEGYIAHSRFAVVLSPTGKKVAVVEEIQGNTVAQAARDRQLALTPLNKARLTAAQRSRDYTLSVNMSDSATQMAQGIEKTREELRELANDGASLSSGTFRVRDMLDEKPRGEFYNMVLDAYQKDLKQAEGVFDIDKLTEYGSGMLIAPMIRPNMFSDDGALLVALSRNATPEQKKLLTDLFQNNDIKTVEGNTATFDDFVSNNTDMYRISSSLERKLVGGEITSGTDRVLAREMLEFLNPLGNFDDQSRVLTDDIATRILTEGDAIDSFITKLGEEAKRKRSKAGQKFVEEYGLDESLQIEEVYTQAQRTGFEGGLMPGQPFAATTHFDEYMPRLILQELIRRGDIDEVVFPSSEALLSVGGRGSLRTGPQRAGFNQTYVKGVDKGLKTIKKENPDFSVEIKENYTPGGDPTDNVTLAGKSRVINLRDPAVRSVFEDRLIRRAKGGEVDLRPRKMIHSGIGAMAKEVM